MEVWDDVPAEVYEPLGIISDDICGRVDQTCEECGKPGQRRPELSLIQTLCDEHFDERMREKKPLKKRAKAEKRKAQDSRLGLYLARCIHQAIFPPAAIPVLQVIFASPDCGMVTNNTRGAAVYADQNIP